MEGAMDSFASKSWWAFALHGAVAVLFGILAWLWPGITLFWLVVLFAAYALFAGAAAVVGAMRNRKSEAG
jgi:uncharacterized membrane protein HdeD (DUF308 family)